jgi:hypothetical protein
MLELFHAVHRYLAGLQAPCLSPYMADWPTGAQPLRNLECATLPVISFLPGISALTDAAAVPMVKSLEACAPAMCWRQTYSREDFGAEFLSKYGLTELAGPRGPMESRQLRCGFLLLGPDVEYPEHRHEPEEVYIPLTPGTLWASGDESWRLRPMCIPIHHPPWTAHAMKTGSHPLLALYLWRGEGLSNKPRID